VKLARNPAFWLLAASILAVVIGSASASGSPVQWTYRILEDGPESAPYAAELQGPSMPDWGRLPSNYFTYADAERAAQIYIRQQERVDA
jgi:hypothetical protein